MKRIVGAIATAVALAVAAAGCDHVENGDDREPHSESSIRIVSLSPAISRTLQDFQLESFIVGRSQYCRLDGASIPVMGDLLHIDYERLIRIDPTHVLVQPPSSGVDSELETLAREHAWLLGSWRLNSIDDIEELVRDLPAVLFPEASEQGRAVALRGAELLNDLASALAPSSPDQWRGRVLLVEAVDPVTVYGTGTYLHDLLLALGCANAVQGRLWPELTLEDVTKLNPDAMILVDANVPESEDAETALGRLTSLEITANRERRRAVLRHPDADLPSTALIDVATELRAILSEFDQTER